MLPDYDTEAAIVGVPQLLVRNEVLGGRYVTNVVGAVPEIVVLGLPVAVPPDISEVTPGPVLPSSLQTVVSVNTVLDVDAFVRINSGVYGDCELFNWNSVTGVPVRLYQPVVVANVVCVPPLPPIRVVPV
jgi:hypothetical protein